MQSVIAGARHDGETKGQVTPLPLRPGKEGWRRTEPHDRVGVLRPCLARSRLIISVSVW
jgi:hypothetical protein